MKGNSCRFDAVLDPTGGWSVWDAEADQPAEMDRHMLIGLDAPRAFAASGVLNRIDRAGLYFPSRTKGLHELRG